MFELENSISQWKHSFQEKSAMTNERIEELESHLRDAVIDLGHKGLNEEEGFLIATKRLGHSTVLASEFEKNRTWCANREHLVWMLSGYLLISLCGIFSMAFSSSIQTGLAFLGADATTSGVVAIAIQLVTWISLLMIVARANLSPFIFAKFPTFSLATMFAATILFPSLGVLGKMAQFRIVDPSWFAVSSAILGLGHVGVQILIYGLCFVVLYKISQPESLALE